jgi:hypothetical protein
MGADSAIGYLVKVPFAALLGVVGLWTMFGLARGLYVGRFPRRSSMFGRRADSDLDYAYRDRDFLGFWGAFNLYVLFLVMIGFSIFELLH